MHVKLYTHNHRSYLPNFLFITDVLFTCPKQSNQCPNQELLWTSNNKAVAKSLTVKIHVLQKINGRQQFFA